jgi:hypothetical protein
VQEAEVSENEDVSTDDEDGSDLDQMEESFVILSSSLELEENLCLVLALTGLIGVLKSSKSSFSLCETGESIIRAVLRFFLTTKLSYGFDISYCDMI